MTRSGDCQGPFGLATPSAPREPPSDRSQPVRPDAGIFRGAAELFLDAQELVVLRDAIGAATPSRS